jgi:hypothetical protein
VTDPRRWRRKFAKLIHIVADPAMFDFEVLIIFPSQLLKLPDQRDRFGIILAATLQYAEMRLVCSARAASGHTAVPPSSVMNSRRLLIRLPRRRPSLRANV